MKKIWTMLAILVLAILAGLVFPDQIAKAIEYVVNLFEYATSSPQ